MEFVQWNMTVQESEELLAQITAAHGQSYVPSPTPWKALRELLTSRVEASDVERYLAELERRKKGGEGLVRPRRS